MIGVGKVIIDYKNDRYNTYKVDNQPLWGFTGIIDFIDLSGMKSKVD